MPEVVKFVSSDDERQTVVTILREALEAAERGEIVSVAVATVERGDDGPATNNSYSGQQHWAALVASVESMRFDMQWGAYAARYGLEAHS